MNSLLTSDPLTFLLAFGLCVLAMICIGVCFSGRKIPQEEPTPRRLGPVMHEAPAASSLEINLAQQKCRKVVGLELVGDGTCAVCLGEYEEGENYRTLPECNHSFHVPCINMWLYSHPTCPVCRASATPLMVVGQHL